MEKEKIYCFYLVFFIKENIKLGNLADYSFNK